jgi:hypothetical protein
MKLHFNMIWTLSLYICFAQVTFAGILVKRVCIPDSCLINVAGTSAASPQFELAVDDCGSFLASMTSTNLVATT